LFPQYFPWSHFREKLRERGTATRSSARIGSVVKSERWRRDLSRIISRREYSRDAPGGTRLERAVTSAAVFDLPPGATQKPATRPRFQIGTRIEQRKWNALKVPCFYLFKHFYLFWTCLAPLDVRQRWDAGRGRCVGKLRNIRNVYLIAKKIHLLLRTFLRFKA